MKKLPAFTLVEMTIGMLIAGVVTYFAYYFLSVFMLANSRYHDKADSVNEYLLFKKSFQNDLARAENVYVDIAQSEVVFKQEDSSFISYLLDSNITRQTSAGSGSFKCSGSINQIKYLDDTVKLVTNLTIKLVVNGENIFTSFSKQYASSQIMMAIDNGR